MKTFIFIICIVFLIGSCSNTKYLMNDVDFKEIKDKSTGIIALGVIANFGIHYAAYQQVTFKIEIPFGSAPQAIKSKERRN